MSITTTAEDPKALQRARAAYLRDLFEPWSLRRLEARTGIGRGKLETRFSGETELAFSDIELLAPVVRMTPEELFSELLNVKLPGLDSNQEPIGFKPAAQKRPMVLSLDTVRDEKRAAKEAASNGHRDIAHTDEQAAA